MIRKYLPTPKLIGSSLPTIPTNPNDWEGMRRLLEAIKKQLEGKPVNATPPGVPQHFIATTQNGGILLTWDKLPNTPHYIIFRGVTNDFSQSKAIIIIASDSPAGATFFDPCGQEAAGTRIFYWVQGWNQLPGPMSITFANMVNCEGDSSCEELPTVFTDTFIRAATTFGLGPNGQHWIVSRGRSNGNQGAFINASGEASIGGSVASAAGGLVVYCVAAPGLFNSVSQYFKFTYKAFTGSFPRGGPGLFFHGDGDPENAGGYFLFLVPDSPTVHFGKWVGTGGGYVDTMTSGLNISTLVADDIFEMQVDTGPTQNTINIWRNNALIVTDYADTDGSRPQLGWPTLCNGNPSGAYQIKNYEVRATR